MAKDSNTDLVGKERFKMESNSYVSLNANANLNNLFNSTDACFIFRIGECKDNEVLFSKGHPTTPSAGSWSIINENKYLKIILHETNGVNSLVFKTSNQILNNQKRITIGINFYDATNNIEVYVNALPELVTLDTSQGHYRTNINQFTGLRVTTDPVEVGRGSGQVYGEFGLYYDLCLTRVLTQSEHNTYYLPLIDNRVLPTEGKILFVTDRFISPFPVTEMDESGVNVATKDSYTSNSVFPSYAKHNNIDFVYNTDNNVVFTYNGVKHLIVDNQSGQNLSSTFNATGSKIYRILNFGVEGRLQELITSTLPSATWANTNPATTAGIFHVDCHPTDNNKMLIVSNNNDGNQPMGVYELDLTTFVRTLKFNTGFTDSGVTTKANIYPGKPRYSKDGTKIGFSCNYQRTGGTQFDLRAYIMNVDGTGLTLLGNNINFCDFITNTKVILEKTISGPGYSNKRQLIIRDLTTNKETNITNHNSNNYHACWRAA